MNEPGSEISDSDSLAPKLRVRKDLPAGIGPVKACPSCNGTVAESAVICIRCGYNFQTGGHLSTSSGMRKTFAVAGTILVGLLVALAAIVYLVNQFHHPTPLPPTQAAPEQPPAPPPPATDAVVIAIAEPIQETETTFFATAETVVREAQLNIERDQLREQLEGRYPPILIGDNVALRMANGFVHRGRYLGMRDGIAVVSDNGERIRVPIAELDRESRLRADPEARELLVEQRLQQMQGVPSL